MKMGDVPAGVKFYYPMVPDTIYWHDDKRIFWDFGSVSYEDSFRDHEVVLVEPPTFDIITALQKLKEGKKVKSVGWSNSNYLYLDTHKVVRDASGSQYILTIGGINDKKLWEEFTGRLSPEELPLNSEYKAVVSSGGIKVGCQEFSFEKLDELVKVAAKFRS